MSREKKSAPVTVNLPREVEVCWDEVRVGYPHTRFAMAGLAAYILLDEPQQRHLMTLVGAVQEGKAPWSVVEEWCRAERERVDTVIQARVREMLRDTHARRGRRSAKRRSGDPGLT